MSANNVVINIESLSNAELISILDQPENYLPQAVELAQQEFQRRSLTQEHIDEVRSYRLQRESAQQEQRDKIRKSIQPVRSKFQKAIATFDPLTTGIPPTDRAIRVIVIVFGLIAVYTLARQYRMAWDFLLYFARGPFESLMFFFAYCTLPISIAPFYRRKKIGWILLVIYLTFACTVYVSTIIELLFLKQESFGLFPTPSPVDSVLYLLFLGATIWALCKKSLREVYKVNNETALKTILFTSVILTLSLYIARHW